MLYHKDYAKYDACIRDEVRVHARRPKARIVAEINGTPTSVP